MGVSNVKVEGLDELHRALKELPERVEKRVVVRSLRKGAEPIKEAGQEYAPVLSGDLKENIIVRVRKVKGRIVALVGPAKKIWYAHFPEFGTKNTSAKPYMRPAFESQKEKALGIIKDEIGRGVECEAAKLAKKAKR